MMRTCLATKLINVERTANGDPFLSIYPVSFKIRRNDEMIPDAFLTKSVCFHKLLIRNKIIVFL